MTSVIEPQRIGLARAASGCFVVLAITLTLAAPAQGASGTWDRAWGQDVDSSTPGTGFEICTVAANCQGPMVFTGFGGELKDPGGVDTDVAGNLYVADSGNNRIQKFDSQGHFLRAWGKDVNAAGGTGHDEICTVAANCQAGSIATAFGGEFNDPDGIAVDSAGNVYVSDSLNNRIQKFDSEGNFQRAWGKDVDNGGGSGFDEICTSTCQAGTSTTAFGGELSDPSGITVDPAGNVYVGDTVNERIQKFDPDGNFLRAWGKDVDSAGGTAFERCTAKASCKKGSTVTAFGGEFNSPQGVGADAAGAIYVADTANARIQKFDSDGNFQRTWGGNVDSVGGTGFGEICTVALSCQTGGLASAGGEFSGLEGVAADSSGHVYVADTGNERIQRFDSDGNFQRAWGKDVDVGGAMGFEICTVAASCQIGGDTTAFGGELAQPEGVAADPAGSLFVSDNANGRIQKYADPPPPPPLAPALASPSAASPPAAKKCKKKKKKKKHAAAAKKCKKKKRKKG